MTFSKRNAALMAFAVAIATSHGTAFAQRTAADVETARELYNQGRELREHGDLRGALEKLKAAHALAKTPITGLELAETYAALGQPVEAREVCLGIARTTVSSEETARSAEARTLAAKMAEAVKPKIATLRIAIQGAPQGTEPTLLIDGLAVPFAAIAEPRKVNPGSHAISARIGSGAESKATVDLGEGETKAVTLTVVPPPVSASPVPGQAPSLLAPDSRKLSPLVWPGFAVAAVGLGVGAVTGVLAISGKSSLDSTCAGTRCAPDSYDALDRAKVMGNVSTVGFIVGAAGAIVGIYGLTHPVLAPRSGAAKPPSIAISPYLGTKSLGIHGSF